MDEAMAVIRALRTVRAPVVLDERALHALIAVALAHAGIAFSREARLGPRCRADFLCAGGVVLEIKRSRPAPGLLRGQLTRYAACEGVSALIVACETAVNTPARVAGKPVFAVSLRALWGVAT